MKPKFTQLGIFLGLLCVITGCVTDQLYHVQRDAFPNNIGQEMPVSQEISAIGTNGEFDLGKSNGKNNALRPFNNISDCNAVIEGLQPSVQEISDDRSCVSVVEFDEFGHLFNRAQMARTVATAEKIATLKKQNPETKKSENVGGIIVVYIHGWNHNAHPEDENLANFRQTMRQMGELDKGAFKDDRRVMGIYVGWRGKSVSVPYLNYLTFWDRKNTAHSVGNGAVFELVKRLSIIRNQNPTSRLVIVGHSFGGAILYSSIWNAILSEILEDPPDAGTIISAENRPKRWDMVVLINPAFEAIQVRAHFEAARARNYSKGQLPHLLIISTEADFANTIAFPLGRHVSTTFKTYGDNTVSPEMNTTAIGQYIPYVTHQLTAKKSCLGDQTKKIKDVFDSSEFCFDDVRTLTLGTSPEKKPIHFPFLTRCDMPGDCWDVAQYHYIEKAWRNADEREAKRAAIDKKLSALGMQKPLGESNSMPERMPIMNIRTTKDIMGGHSDIWTDAMKGFLVQFMLLTVGSPLENNAPRTNSPSTPLEQTLGSGVR